MSKKVHSQKPIANKAEPIVKFLLAPGSVLRTSRRGFTLIEAIVGAMLFALTVAIATGFFVNISRAQRKAFLESQILDGARYAMDTMAKALRVAEPIDAIVESNDPEIVITPTSIRFHHPMKSGTLGCPPSPPCIVTFAKSGTALTETDWDGNPLTSPGTTFSLTGPRLIVDDFRVVDGSSIAFAPADVLQPRITLFLKVREVSQPASAAVSFQTTVTLRELQR